MPCLCGPALTCAVLPRAAQPNILNLAFAGNGLPTVDELDYLKGGLGVID